MNIHLTLCGAGSLPAGTAPAEESKAFRDAGTQTDPEASPPRAPRAAREEAWAYAVGLPAGPGAGGAHCGGRRAWQAIEAQVGGYCHFRGDRLRRFASEAAAIAGYLEQADRHGAPVPPPLHRW